MKFPLLGALEVVMIDNFILFYFFEKVYFWTQTYGLLLLVQGTCYHTKTQPLQIV